MIDMLRCLLQVLRKKPGKGVPFLIKPLSFLDVKGVNREIKVKRGARLSCT